MVNPPIEHDKYSPKHKLCPVCGADKQVWKEVFGEEHYCDPKWKEA